MRYERVKDIKFGVWCFFEANGSLELTLTGIILLGKCFIHKCRYFKSNSVWTIEDGAKTLKSLKLGKDKTCLELFSLLNMLNLI